MPITYNVVDRWTVPLIGRHDHETFPLRRNYIKCCSYYVSVALYVCQKNTFFFFFSHIPSQWPLLQYDVPFCSSLIKFLLVTSLNDLSQFFFHTGMAWKEMMKKENQIFCARCKRRRSNQAMLKDTSC